MKQLKLKQFPKEGDIACLKDNNELVMKNVIKGYVTKQNDIFLLKVSNKKIKQGFAFIVNQKDITDTYYYKKEYSFKIIGINKCTKEYQNLHIIKNNDIFNLIGTNGNVSSLKELLKYNYIPCLVELIK